MISRDGGSNFQSTRTRSRSPATAASYSTTLAPPNTTPPPSREVPRSLFFKYMIQHAITYLEFFPALKNITFEA